MYPVDLHAHTVASDHAYSNISDYVNVAKQRGIQLFGITNHGPDLSDGPHCWHFMNLAVIPRIIDGIGILYGIEANIKSIDGETDCSPKMRPHLDLVLAGFHDDLMSPQDRDGNTQALINTMAKGSVHIISHPGNPKFPINITEVAQATAKYNVALEINNSSFVHSRPGSQDTCTQIAQAVKEAGGWLSLGSDSHIASALGIFDKSLEIINAVNFPEERILNVSPRRLLDFLASHNGKEIPEFAHL